MLRDGLHHRLVDPEPEARRHDDGAEHADGIFLEAIVGIADAAQQAVLQVFQAADVVDDREVGDVVEQRVDGEVAAEGVFFGRAKRVVVLDQQVGRVGRVGGVRRGQRLGRLGLGASRDVLAEGRDFNGLHPEADVGEAEAAADDPTVPKELLDLVGVGRGADVEVFGPPAQEEVADAAADEIGRVA